MIYDTSQNWLELLYTVSNNGVNVISRGLATKEILHNLFIIDMRYPVVRVPARKLNYKFMAAEAFWILTGDDRVETISPYNPHIAKFSDDGERFFGAYGPKIRDQMHYVVGKLIEDPGSRQAGLTIWRENPPQTKDVPCTVAMFFSIRDKELNCHVFMRSSDVWLGIPYDVFNFSMVSHRICCEINAWAQREIHPDRIVWPGKLYLTAASSHLYHSDMKAAEKVLEEYNWDPQEKTPSALCTNLVNLTGTLMHLRESSPGDDIRWWEPK